MCSCDLGKYSLDDLADMDIDELVGPEHVPTTADTHTEGGSEATHAEYVDTQSTDNPNSHNEELSEDGAGTTPTVDVDTQSSPAYDGVESYEDSYPPPPYDQSSEELGVTESPSTTTSGESDDASTEANPSANHSDEVGITAAFRFMCTFQLSWRNMSIYTGDPSELYTSPRF